MLKIVHLLAGIVALPLSFAPGILGGAPFFQNPDAICLLLIGLLNVQLVVSLQGPQSPQRRPLLQVSSILLLLALLVQAAAVLAPLPAIAGQSTLLLSLLLTCVAVALHLATTQLAGETRGTEHQARRPRTAPATTPAAPATSAPEAGRETGTVKWFNTSKGFGFISRDNGDDLFVHFRAIRGEGHRILMEGQRVEFAIQKRERGLQAEDVVTLD